MTILKVAVPVPVDALFDYLPPLNIGKRQLQPGVRLLVPFGTGTRCGLLIESQTTGGEGRELKRAVRLLDSEPLLKPAELALLYWAAGYYRHPLGEVVASVLPQRLRRGDSLLDLGRVGWRLTGAGMVVDPRDLSNAPRQAELLDLLRGCPGGMAQEVLERQWSGGRSSLRRLQDKGWLARVVLPADTTGADTRVTEKTGVVPPRLNTEQQLAVESVAAKLGAFSVFLLDGVTGSGKTEVYLRLIEMLVEQPLQVLVLVPEIGLTPQLLRRFQQRIGAPILVLHSGLTAHQRQLAWQRARDGLARVVLGTRSAVFTPLPNLGLILVDEEHDISLKQQDGFRYSARDIAVVRGQRANCPVVLGTATPSLESLRNARDGRYRHLQLSQRAGLSAEPRVDLIDVRSIRLEAGVSPLLLRQVGETLAAGNQVLLYLNRRGYAPVVTCYACGWVAQCCRCDANMTLHQSSQSLWCHHCGAQRSADRACPECEAPEVHLLGEGTERLEEFLQSRFEDYGIARIDRDSTRRKGSLDRLLDAVRAGRFKLLLGTQMLAKGHHFPNVTLVGILNVDQGLYGADFRAAERMAQQIVQVSGRAGRADKPGRVLIQTRHPDHPLLRSLLRSGYAQFAREALEERRAAGLPPYSHQVLLRAEAASLELPMEFLHQAAESGKPTAGTEVQLWGPVPAPMERRAGRYRAQLLLQSARRGQLQRFLEGWLPRLRKLKSARRVRWSVDVDPQEML